MSNEAIRREYLWRNAAQAMRVHFICFERTKGQIHWQTSLLKVILLRKQKSNKRCEITQFVCRSVLM